MDKDFVARLRAGGASCREIAREAGCSPMGAWLACRDHVASGGVYADQIRALELGRLEERLDHLTQRRAELVGARPEGTQQ